jgi:hypothetical protein
VRGNSISSVVMGRLDKPTGGGGRTHTPFRETDFESVASASSATPAKVVNIILYGVGV